MLFLTVTEIPSATTNLSTVLSVMLHLEPTCLQAKSTTDSYINYLSKDKKYHSSLWLRFFPLDYGHVKYWGADYGDLIRKAREQLNKSEFAFLQCNFTTMVIPIAELMAFNTEMDERSIENFCTIPKQSSECSLFSETLGEDHWIIKSFEACDEIATSFKNSFILNPQELREKDKIKELLGTNTISLSPPSDSVRYIPQNINAHHEHIKKYLSYFQISYNELTVIK